MAPAVSTSKSNMAKPIASNSLDCVGVQHIESYGITVGSSPYAGHDSARNASTGQQTGLDAARHLQWQGCHVAEKADKSEKYDIVEGPHCDLSTVEGFKHLLSLAVRLEEDGLAVCGLPCTSYVFINAGTHGRTADCPYGREGLGYIQTANLITTRLMVLMILSVRCCYWLIEQPGSSRLLHHPERKYLLDLLEKLIHQTFFTRFSMGSWGAKSLKPSLAIGLVFSFVLLNSRSFSEYMFYFG